MKIGVVVIGRNEGVRLQRCVASVLDAAQPVVYVDSGSTDGSVTVARSMGASIVQLDMSTPFTAARARNAGFDRLLESAPDVELVQFVDGDCQIVDGWLSRAADAMRGQAELAVVAGRVRELNIGASIYNRLCDLEWNQPAGPTREVGGIFMIRAAAFKACDGFNLQLIAGEEPELCLRLRRAGWRLERLEADMALHDAAMTRFAQWWKRSVRAGYAYANGLVLHGRSGERFCVRESLRIWFWALALPVAAIAAAWVSGGWSLLLLAAYPALVVKIAIGRRRSGDSWPDALLYSVFCVGAKFPQWWGQVRFFANAMRKRQGQIIEYKTVTSDE